MVTLKNTLAAVALTVTGSIAANAAVTFNVYNGNDNASLVDDLINAGIDDEWALGGKYDIKEAAYTGNTFTITGVPGKSGTWSSSFGVDAVAIKGGNQFLLVDYSSIGPVFGDNWCTDGSCDSVFGGDFLALFVGKGNNPDISHLSLYTLTRITSAIPEPATWLMMIMGFGLAGIASRRRSAIQIA